MCILLYKFNNCTKSWLHTFFVPWHVFMWIVVLSFSLIYDALSNLPSVTTYLQRLQSTIIVTRHVLCSLSKYLPLFLTCFQHISLRCSHIWSSSSSYHSIFFTCLSSLCHRRSPIKFSRQLYLLDTSAPPFPSFSTNVVIKSTAPLFSNHLVLDSGLLSRY